MAVYEYKAFDVDAATVAGTVVAGTPRQARDVLRDRGLSVAQLRQLRRQGRLWPWLPAGSRRHQVVAFTRELSTLLGAGIPLLEALQTLTAQHGRRFRPVIQAVADDVSGGLSLADALVQHEAWFDELCISIVRVGENTGALSEALDQLADFKEKADRLRSRLVTAMLYPAVVLTIGLLVCVFLMTYVVPELLATLSQAGRELPAVTRVVKACSDFLRRWWWALGGGALLVAVAARVLLISERRRLVVHRAILRIPLLGALVRKENTSRMAIILSALLRNGLQFTEAIRITRQTLRNRAFRQAMAEYEKAVTAGSDIAAPLRKARVFSPMVVQMLAVGQQAGELEAMLDRLASALQRQVDTAVRRLTAALEPLLIVLLAIVVGTIAMATILPILEISNVL